MGINLEIEVVFKGFLLERFIFEFSLFCYMVEIGLSGKEIEDRVNAYLEYCERYKQTCFRLEYEGLFHIIGGKDMNARPFQGVAKQYVKGRFIDVLAYAVNQLEFYSAGTMPVINFDGKFNLGDGHIVEINAEEIPRNADITALLKEPVKSI